jgi:hypothetical protein
MAAMRTERPALSVLCARGGTPVHTVPVHAAGTPSGHFGITDAAIKDGGMSIMTGAEVM